MRGEFKLTATVTYDDLVKNDACEERDVFKGVFGNKTEITVALAKKHAMDFDWSWAANNLLPGKLYEQWSRQQESFRTRYRADLELIEYKFHYTPTGVRRTVQTEKQKKTREAAVDAIQRKVREQEAVAFAQLFIGKSRFKRAKSDLLLEQLQSRMEGIVRELIQQNEKDQFMDSEDYRDSIRGMLNEVRYRVPEIHSEIRRAAHAKRREQRNAERRARAEDRRAQTPILLRNFDDVDEDDFVERSYNPF